MHTKEDFKEHVLDFSSRPCPDGSPVIFFVRAAGCIMSTHLDGMLEMGPCASRCDTASVS